MRIVIRRVRINDRIPYMMHNDINIKHAYRNGLTIVDEYDVGEPTINPYAEQYFTIESLEDNNTIEFKKDASLNAPNITYYISTDLQNWTEYNNVSVTVVVSAGRKLYFKSNAGTLANIGASSSYWYFTASKTINVYGNAMSLLYGDNFANKKSLQYNYALAYLFYNCTKLVSAENLILPATSLTDLCYYAMFSGCWNLTIAPELPAAYLVNQCYAFMFQNCYALSSMRCKAQYNLPTGSGFDTTQNWLQNAGYGTFKYVAGVNWPYSESGIPNGWSRITY